MEASNGPSKHTLLLMFGLPILQTAIICASMYVGHILTKRMDRQQAAKAAPAPMTVQPASTQISIAAPLSDYRAEPMTAMVPKELSAPIVPTIPAATAAKSAEKPEIVSMHRAVDKLTPATPAVPVAAKTAVSEAAKPIEKPKVFVRTTPQKPVMIPLVRPTEKPAAIPTPLLVPKKDPQKTGAIQIEADETPARVQIREARPVQKTEPIAEVKMEAKVAPKPVQAEVVAAPSVVPATVVSTPAVTATPAPRVNVEVVPVTPPQPVIEADVATAEPVRRTPVVAPRPVEPAPQPVQPVQQPVRPTAQLTAPVSAPSAPSEARSTGNEIRSNEGRMILASSPVAPTAPAAHSHLLLGRHVRDEDISLDSFYALMTKYIDAYSSKKGLNPTEENKRWMKRWMDNVEQAMADGDSSEQQYINRVTIAKRDCFNIEKAEVSKVVEGCRILLRYRDGGFTWLSAMREALTRENLKKTLVFLNAGPQL